MRGYIYIIANAGMPNQVKVGYTTRTPAERANDLYQNNSGISARYQVLYAIAIEEFYLREQYNNQTDRSILQRLEQDIHQELDSQRINQKREWFRVESGRELQQIVRTIKRLANSYARYQVAHNELGSFSLQPLAAVATVAAAAPGWWEEQLPLLQRWWERQLPRLQRHLHILLGLFIVALCTHFLRPTPPSFRPWLYPCWLVCGAAWGYRRYLRKGAPWQWDDFAEFLLPTVLLLAALLEELLPRPLLAGLLNLGLFFYLLPLARR